MYTGILTDRKRLSRLTRGCNSVLPGRLVVAQGKQHGLDGSNEDSSQTSVEDNIEQQNFDCKRRRNGGMSANVLHRDIHC